MKYTFTLLLAFVATLPALMAAPPSVSKKQSHAFKANIHEICYNYDNADDFYMARNAEQVRTILENHQRQAATTVIPLGSSYNIYSAILNTPNQVSYDPNINSVSFIHRQNFGEPGGSGIISYDYSIDGGATWDANNKQITPTLELAPGNTGNGNRYPNGAIYNPIGNTNPANAYFVGVGPALHTDPLNGNGWGWEFVASSSLVFDAATVNEAYYTNADTTIFHPYALQQNAADGSLWYLSVTLDTDNASVADYSAFYATKLTWDAGTSSFTRTVAGTIAADYTGLTGAATVGGNASDWGLAFGPDGNTGYAFFVGPDNTQDTLAFLPVMFKTTDAGASWTKVGSFDYNNTPGMSAIVPAVDLDGDGTSDPIGTAPQIPFFSAVDAVVDADGYIHFVAEVSGSATYAAGDVSNADLGSRWIGRFTNDVYHVYENASGWNADYVANIDVDGGTVGTVENLYSHPNITRTAAGDVVMMTWSNTDTLTSGITTNDAPDVYGYAYRLTDGFVAGPDNLTAGTDGEQVAYWPKTAPVCITNGDDKDFEFCIAFATPSDVADDLAQLDYFYLKGTGFNNTDFYDRSFVSTNELEPFAAEVRLFPTPATTTLNINLGEAFDQGVNLTVVDMNGRLIERIQARQENTTLDVSSYTQGMYFVRVLSDNGQICKKFTVLR